MLLPHHASFRRTREESGCWRDEGGSRPAWLKEARATGISGLAGRGSDGRADSRVPDALRALSFWLAVVLRPARFEFVVADSHLPRVIFTSAMRAPI